MCCISFFSVSKGVKSVGKSLESLTAEVTLAPYSNWKMHVDYSVTFIGHLVRASVELIRAIVNLALAAPALLLSPCELPKVPVVVASHLAAACLNLAASVTAVGFFALRTLSSMVLGYQADLEQDQQQDYKTAMFNCF